jgi:hypothetical protein
MDAKAKRAFRISEHEEEMLVLLHVGAKPFEPEILVRRQPAAQ